MQTWRCIFTLALLASLFGACDLSLKTEQSVPATSVFSSPEAPVLCVEPDHSSSLRLQFQSPFRGPEPWRLPACVGEAMANIVWHYTNALFWLAPFIGGWGRLTPVEQFIPALAVYLYPVMFAVSQAAPTPTPVQNPYNSQGGIARAAHATRRQPAPSSATAAGSTLRRGAGRPAGSKNKRGSQQPGPNHRTASRQEAVRSTPRIDTMFRPEIPTPGPVNTPSPRITAASASPNSRSGGRGGGESDGGSAGSNSAPQQNPTSFTSESSGGGSGSGSSCPSVHPQRAWIEEVKNVVKACRKHESGKVTRITPVFPYNGGWAHPPLPSLHKGPGLPPVGPFYLKKVFVWVPEYIWDDIEYIPCPHCGKRAQPDGWNTEPRRVFLDDDVCYLIGYRYLCKGCTDASKDRPEDERKTQTFNAWDAGVLAKMDDYVSKEFPFVL